MSVVFRKDPEPSTSSDENQCVSSDEDDDDNFLLNQIDPKLVLRKPPVPQILVPSPYLLQNENLDHHLESPELPIDTTQWVEESLDFNTTKWVEKSPDFNTTQWVEESPDFNTTQSTVESLDLNTTLSSTCTVDSQLTKKGHPRKRGAKSFDPEEQSAKKKKNSVAAYYGKLALKFLNTLDDDDDYK